ncbi:unnamed protein product [Gongylonema pulchrum]|uniref:Multifunctional methyltransferase subunit TRM112-like protein n=1 Tax=Gongylonema pulchrum TaxID=637853 RepID=A0A183ET77_9BILA|nr:unnamed protein product [Gongylonema pulchrum]
MKLLAHNFLSSCFLKGVKEGYPLILTATKKEVQQHEFNRVFVQRMIPKVNYEVLRQAASSIGEGDNLPECLPEQLHIEEDENTELEPLLKELHRVMVSVEILEGELKCPESGRVFPIRDGIPNMIANEDEVK